MMEKTYNSNSGLFLYTIHCDGDDCEKTLPPRGSDSIAFMIAIDAGWKVRQPKQKFSGVATEDFCPKCKNKQTAI